MADIKTQETAAEERAALLPIVDRFIDEPRRLRVIVIGAGITGINAGILLPAKVPNIALTIYEKNPDFGGTWLENVYPGVRCDVPSHVYQSTFAPNVDWSDKFSPGAEIRDYWQQTARRFGVDKLTVFGRRVDELAWDAAGREWRVTLHNVDTGARETATADFVLPALGRFNAWKLPDYPGLADYQGRLRHASDWDASLDDLDSLAGQSVAVIGNGASGIQLLANLQPHVARLDHYARRKTWIAGSFIGGFDERTLAPQPIDEDLRASFRRDLAALSSPSSSASSSTYLAYRKSIEDRYWRRYRAFLRDSPENQALREACTDVMKQRLAAKPELIPLVVPDASDFSPHCRRLTPGPGYLEALTRDNVAYIRTPIRRFTATGIETVDGVQRQVDAVFCATGANVDQVPPFPILGVGGRDLRRLWRPFEEGEAEEKGKEKEEEKPKGYGFPRSYLGNAVPGFPNLLLLYGPNSSGISGTLPHNAETQVTFAARVLRKVAYEGIQTIQPSEAATNDFCAFTDNYFRARTVLAENCSSWYNGGRPGGRVNAVWPGSSLHAHIVRQNPRWEDWEYEYLDDGGVTPNRFAWYFGNGMTRRETDPAYDVTHYLQVGEPIDLKAVHEAQTWW